MQPTVCASLPADVPETACGDSAQPARHSLDAQVMINQPFDMVGVQAGPQPSASVSSNGSLAVTAALQYRQMKQGQSFAGPSSSKMPSAPAYASPTALAASSSVGSSSSSSSSVSSLYGRLRSVAPGLATAGASAVAAAHAAAKPRCEIISQPPLPLNNARPTASAASAACVSSHNWNSNTTPPSSTTQERPPVPTTAVPAMQRSSSIPHPTRTAPLGPAPGYANKSSSCPTTNTDPTDTDMLSLLLAATHMSGAAAGMEPLAGWNSSSSGSVASVALAGQPVMQQQLQQLQNQAAAAGGLAPHMHVAASLPASMNSMLGGVAPMPGQQQQQLLLQQQLLAGSSLTAGNGPSSANSSTTFNNINLPISATPLPADAAAVPAYLGTAATGPEGLAGSNSECSNDVLLLLQQQLLGQGHTWFSGTAAAAVPGAQQLQDVMLLDPCGFNAVGLTTLQGLPVGPTDCMLPGSMSSMSASDPAGGISIKGEKHGAHAPHNPLYKTELCRSWLDAGSCRYGIRCQFAHGHLELRPIVRPPKYKTQPCRTFSVTGSCPYGARCNFIHNEGNVLSGLAEAVRSSVQGIGSGLRAGGAAVSAMLGVPAGTAVAGSSNGSWPGDGGLAGGVVSNMGSAVGSDEGGSSVAAALAAAGFGGGAAGVAAATAALGNAAVPASSSCSGSSGGVWPAGMNDARLSSGSGATHSRNSSISTVPGMMQHSMPGMAGVGGVATAGACNGSLQALLLQLPLVQGGEPFSSAMTAQGYNRL